MHANIQAICSGTFVIQTSHMACNNGKKKKKKIKHGKHNKLWTQIWFVNNFKTGTYVFAVDVFLLITNALACHLLQCSAHITCYLFLRFIRWGWGKTVHKSLICGIVGLENKRMRRSTVCQSDHMLCAFFIVSCTHPKLHILGV